MENQSGDSDNVSNMDVFGPAVVLGLCFGFMFGIGCSLAVMYSIFLGGYRKAVEDSLKDKRPKRFEEAMRKLRKR